MKMKLNLYFLAVMLMPFSLFADTTVPVTLQNYLGTGSNPNLTMKITGSGAGSAVGNEIGYGYGYKFNPPTWIAANIYDEKNNYYGTLSTTYGNDYIGYKSYTGGDGYFLCNIKVSFASQDNNTHEKFFNVTTTKICNPSITNCKC